MTDAYFCLRDYALQDGRWHPCGFRLRHSIRKVDGDKPYEVCFYVPGYGEAKTRRYRTLRGAKTAIGKFDKQTTGG